MRYILGAMLLIGAALFLANPEIFGNKNKFKLSSGGQISIDQRGAQKIEINWDAISSNLVGLVSSESPNEAEVAGEIVTSSEEVVVATVQTEPTVNAPQDAQILSVTPDDTPDLTSYDGQLSAIALAIESDSVRTHALMQAAVHQCLGAETPETIQNYFLKLVELAATAKNLPDNEQRAYFTSQNAELTTTLKFWLRSQPENARVSANNILKSWAARPTDLVACHLEWLQAQ